MEKNKPNFIDLFAGCGGISLGLENAGFAPVFVNEIDDSALETYLVNRDHSFPYLRDPSFHSKNIKDCTSSSFINELRHNLDIKLGIKEIDLVCGGPPCQGFSGIGHRRSYKVDKQDIPSNHLFEHMAVFIKKIKPKIFLFENVQGLLRSRWTKNGKKGEVFEDVFAAFSDNTNYKVSWDMVYSKDYGVPQRRPRVFIVGIRNDIISNKKQHSKRSIELGHFPKGEFKAPSIESLLSDLVDDDYRNGSETFFYPKESQNKIQDYFRKSPSGKIFKKGDSLSEQQYSKHSKKVTERFKSIIENDGKIINEFKNKKFAQRILPKTWSPSGPNITITSMPDDFIHYSQPRAPTLRECARIQTFPDWYQFKGKRTTGGKRRAGVPTDGDFQRELPKFTQIGNAIPVMLGEKIGNHFLSILEKGIL